MVHFESNAYLVPVRVGPGFLKFFWSWFGQVLNFSFLLGPGPPLNFLFKSQIKARDSDGPDQVIDLNRPTYEQIHQMIFTDGTQNEFKPMNKLKLEIKNLQALNIKGSLNFISQV